MEEHSMVAISQSDIDKWQKQIDLLKPRKRKNWKSYLVDKWGVKSRVKYEDGNFYNWDIISSCWAKVISNRKLIFMGTACGTSPFMQTVNKLIKKHNITDPEDIDQMMDLCVQEHKNKSHTGNHTPLAERASPDKRRYAIPAM